MRAGLWGLEGIVSDSFLEAWRHACSRCTGEYNVQEMPPQPSCCPPATNRASPPKPWSGAGGAPGTGPTIGATGASGLGLKPPTMATRAPMTRPSASSRPLAPSSSTGGISSSVGASTAGPEGALSSAQAQQATSTALNATQSQGALSAEGPYTPHGRCVLLYTTTNGMQTYPSLMGLAMAKAHVSTILFRNAVMETARMAHLRMATQARHTVVSMGLGTARQGTARATVA